MSLKFISFVSVFVCHCLLSSIKYAGMFHASICYF